MLRAVWELLVDAYEGWAEDSAPVLAAAAAYYLLVTIAPLLMVLLWLGGLALGSLNLDSLTLTPGGSVEATQTLNRLVENYRDNIGGNGTLVALGIAVWGASAFMGRLVESLDIVFGSTEKELEGWKAFLRRRALSLAALVGLVVVALGASIAYTAVQAAISAAESAIDTGLSVPTPLQTLLDAGPWVGLAALTMLFALAFAYLPGQRNRLRDVLPGALFTAGLYAAGQAVLSWYLGRSSLITAYGAASGFVAFVVWAYYTMQVVLLGAEFTRAWIGRGGLSGLRQSARSGEA